MATVKLATIKRLFAESGNLCAFPECSEPIIDDNGVPLGEICHLHAQNPGGPRFEPSLSNEEVHEYDNLILLCPNHHKRIDGDPDRFPAEVLQALKQVHRKNFGRAETGLDAMVARMLIDQLPAAIVSQNSGNVAIGSPGAVQGQTINIRARTRKTTVAPPPGSIGADRARSAYVSYLIKRYNEFAEKEPSRQRKFHHGVVSRNIEQQFGAQWKLIGSEQFAALCQYLHSRIDKTRLAKLNWSKGHRAYSTFAEHQAKGR